MTSKANIHITPVIITIIACIAAFAIYFYGKTAPEVEQSSSIVGSSSASTSMFDVQTYTQQAISELSEQEKELWNSTKEGTAIEKAAFWASIDRNDIASVFYNKNAQDAKELDLSADKYVRASRETVDENPDASNYFLEQAINTYQKALDKGANIETKLKLAKIYTDVSQQVMQGVALLKEIIEEDPTHIQANFELGMLSLQSGQIDKAIERFDTVIENKPNFIEPYLYKMQLLLDQGKSQEAIKLLDTAIKHSQEENKERLLKLRESIINN